MFEPRRDVRFLLDLTLLSSTSKMEETHSPAPATTAEEAMSAPREMRTLPLETRVLAGEQGASGGAAPVGGVVAGARGRKGESVAESEAWAAAVPPVRTSVCWKSCFQEGFGLVYCSPLKPIGPLSTVEWTDFSDAQMEVLSQHLHGYHNS